jgi:hypothetical protein
LSWPAATIAVESADDRETDDAAADLRSHDGDRLAQVCIVGDRLFCSGSRFCAFECELDIPLASVAAIARRATPHAFLTASATLSRQRRL